MVSSRASLKRWRDKNPGYGKAWRIANFSRMLFYQARRRAKLDWLAFDITIENCQIPEFCPVLGFLLDPSADNRSDNLPSLDRIDNAKGYTKDNVRVISWRANRLKSDGTLDDFKRIVNWMEAA